MTRKRARPAFSTTVESAVRAVLDYLWDDEETDYLARTEPERSGHLFEELQTIRSWLNRTPAKSQVKTGSASAPPEYVAKERAAPRTQPAKISGPEEVHEMFRRLHHLKFEEFHILLLNGSHEVTRRVMVSRGTLNKAMVHPRDVFRPAIRASAAAVILVHNHPSGNAEPSADDIAITKRLVEVGRLHDIRVLDHIVVSKAGFASLASRGLV